MKIRELRKYQKIKNFRDLTENEYNIVKKQLLHLNKVSLRQQWNLELLLCSILDLFIEIKDIDSLPFVKDIGWATILKVDKVDDNKKWLQYSISYNADTYQYSDGIMHGGYCTTSDLYRKLILEEINKII